MLTNRLTPYTSLSYIVPAFTFAPFFFLHNVSHRSFPPFHNPLHYIQFSILIDLFSLLGHRHRPIMMHRYVMLEMYTNILICPHSRAAKIVKLRRRAAKIGNSRTLPRLKTSRAIHKYTKHLPLHSSGCGIVLGTEDSRGMERATHDMLCRCSAKSVLHVTLLDENKE